MRRTGGSRRKTRHSFSKNIREKGKVSIRKYIQSFKEGEKVCLLAEPAIHTGLYFRRFHGKSGIVKGKMGSCYEIQIEDGKSKKLVVVHPVHLKRL